MLMRIYLPSAVEAPPSEMIKLIECLASRATPALHTIIDDPADADLILFCDAHTFQEDDFMVKRIRRSPLWEAYPEKCFVYDERDQPWCHSPGLYVSMPRRRFKPQLQRSCCYARVKEERFAGAEAVPADLLFSFVGSLTHPVREEIFRLDHPRAVVEPVSDFMFWDASSPDFEAKRRHFAEVLLRSKFVLCPRGRGTASIRLFETMAAGRVPVIISDDWVPPDGPDWPTFSLTVREAQVPNLMAIIEGAEADFDQLARAASDAYASWFSEEVLLNRMVEGLASIPAEGAARMWWRRRQTLNVDFWYAALRVEGVRKVKRGLAAVGPRSL